MNNSAAKVGEIFREAGTAFTKLSEMTLMLQPMDDSPPGGKWSDEDVEMLRGCINRFAVELNKISQHIKTRTMNQWRCLLEMDIFPPRQAPPLPHMPLQLPAQNVPQQPSQNFQQRHHAMYLQLQPQRLQQSLVYNHQHFFRTHVSYLEQRKNRFLNHYLEIFQSELIYRRILYNQNRRKALELQELYKLYERKKIMAARKHQQQEHLHLQEKKPQAPKGPTQQPSVNIYAQGFPAKSEDFLYNFNPSVVQPKPPLIIMEEDTRIQPSAEFEDLQDSLVDKTLSTIPDLIRSLESDQSTDCLNSRETSLDNIGTLHTVSKEAHFSLRQAKETWGHVSAPVNNANPTTHTEKKPHGNVTCDGAFSSIFKPNRENASTNNMIQGPKSKSVDKTIRRNETQTKANKQHTNKKISNGYFSSIFKHKDANKERREKVLENKNLKQCQRKKEKEPDNKNISTEAVTALLCNNSSTLSLEMPTGIPVGCALDAICFNKSCSSSIENIIHLTNFPVLFGKNGVNDANRGAQGEPVDSLPGGKSKHFKEDNIESLCCNYSYNGPCTLLEDSNTKNDLFQMQPTYDTKAELDYKKEGLPSLAQLTEGPKRRGRLRPQAESTPHASADCTVPPIDVRMTRSRRRLACLCEDLEELPPQKRVRKTSTVTTPRPTTRASKKTNTSK